MRLSLLGAVPVTFAILGGLAVVATSAGCSSSPDEKAATADAVGRAESAIINGQLDTTHQAVVALYLQEGQQGGICSGTIVKVDAQRHIGWVATAAHCVTVPPVVVIQGDDMLAESSLRYDVIDFEADGRYTGQTASPYDFAVVRIAGVDATTPVIPLIGSPDGLTDGQATTSVGYGRTTLIETGNQDENTRRRSVNQSLAQVQTRTLAYNQAQRGICQGDSGGPVLVKASGGERVAGIHSYVSGDCDGYAYSGRVSAGSAFWNAELGKALPADSCSLCEKVANSGNSECAQITRSCLADKECRGYYECYTRGTPKADCFAKYPRAEGPFNAALNCTCTRGCAEQCGATLACKNAPKCGYKLPAGECTTCSEGACCQETTDCAADGTCYLCLKQKDKDPACAENAARKKLANCVASKCTTECEGSGLETGADPPAEEPPVEGGGPATTTTVTKTGCAAAPGTAGGASGAGLAVAVGLLLAARRRRSL